MLFQTCMTELNNASKIQLTKTTLDTTYFHRMDTFIIWTFFNASPFVFHRINKDM